MFLKNIVFISVFAFSLALTPIVYSSDKTKCVDAVGGGVICQTFYAHKMVDAGWDGINFGLAGIILVLSSAGLFLFSKRFAKITA